jgi:hypothetical protein
MTALMWSAYGGDVKSATVLLEAGALPNLRSEVLFKKHPKDPLIVHDYSCSVDEQLSCGPLNETILLSLMFFFRKELIQTSHFHQ